MSDTKWTPGPWRVLGKDIGIVGRYVQDDYGTVEVCRVGAFGDKELLPFNRDRWTADAHVIAAAPDLYEALNEAVADLICTRNSAWHSAKTDPRWEGVSDILSERVNECRAALAKARGES